MEKAQRTEANAAIMAAKLGCYVRCPDLERVARIGLPNRGVKASAMAWRILIHVECRIWFH